MPGKGAEKNLECNNIRLFRETPDAWEDVARPSEDQNVWEQSNDMIYFA